MSTDCEDCTRCTDCNRSWCRTEQPSPGEPEGRCADCHDAEVVEGRLRARDYDRWASL